jgi:hypothetical protein
VKVRQPAQHRQQANTGRVAPITSTARFFRVVITLIVAVLVCFACSGGAQRIPGEGRIAGFERYRHWLSVFVGPGVTFPQLFRLDQLSGFAPGAPPFLAGLTHGPPDTIRHGPGAEYYIYRTSWGVIEVGRESVADGGVGYPVYYYPVDRRPEAFLPREILSQIRVNAEKEVLMIFECGVDQPGLTVVLENGQVDHVIWMSVTQLTLRRDPRQCTPWTQETR